MILTQSFDILFVLKCYTLFWILLNKSLLVPFIGSFNFKWTLRNFACYGWETNSLNKLVQKRWVLSTIKLHFVHAFTNLNMCHYAYFSSFSKSTEILCKLSHHFPADSRKVRSFILTLIPYLTLFAWQIWKFYWRHELIITST